MEPLKLKPSSKKISAKSLRPQAQEEGVFITGKQLISIQSKTIRIEKMLGKENSILKKQLTSVLEKKLDKKKIVVAYEPIWSIGTGKIPTKIELQKTTIHIKKILKNIFGKKSPAVLYGGSVDGNNVKMFREIREIDGFLIGGASKSSKKFIDIIKNYYR